MENVENISEVDGSRGNGKTPIIIPLYKPVYETTVVDLIGTAPMLVAHALQWDTGKAYWERQPPEISEKKVKRPNPAQLALLKALTAKYGAELGVAPYDKILGLDEFQEALLRGHWLPDLSPAFPVSGFQAALAAGAASYGGKNQGMSAKKLRAICLIGDGQNPVLARIFTPIEIDYDMGQNSGMVKSPRQIVRLRFPVGWTTRLINRYNPALIQCGKVVQAHAWAGDFGVGQWRPSSPHGGNHGTFRLYNPSEAPQEKQKGKRKKNSG